MPSNFKTILLSAGMVSVGFYLLHVVLGGLMWKGYSHLQQPISDLTAAGAPDRPLMLVLTNIYGTLALIFAVSFTVTESRNHGRLVFLGGISMIILQIISISYSFFPQDLPGSETTTAGFMHMVVTIMIVPFTIMTPLLIGFGLRKEKEWKPLGTFSIICAGLIFALGGLTGYFFANQLPFFGLLERLNIGTLMIWIFVLSLRFSCVTE